MRWPARAPSRLALLGAATVLCACPKTPREAQSPDPSGGSQVQVAPGPAPEARDPVERISWSIDSRDLAGVLRGGEAILGQLRPGTPINLRAVVESFAAQQGLPKAFTDALDWSGRFAIDIAYPQPDQAHARPDDVQVRANLAALDAAAALRALPESWSATMHGEREASAQREGVELVFRALSGALLVGRSPGDLDAATQMAGRTQSYALEVHAENLHQGDVDPSSLMELPGGLAGPISAALERATALDIGLDLAAEADLRAHLRAAADLSSFGFDPLGAPLARASKLGDRLPGGADALALMSWGDPKLIHRELDRYAEMIPEPFDGWTAEIIAGAHAVIDQVREEVAFGIWVDDDGKAALVVAARVAEPEAARAAVRRVVAGLDATARRYTELMGDDKDYRATVSYKPEGLVFSKAKVDLFSATIPKAFEADAARVKMLVGSKKPKLELLALVEGEYGIVVIGEGARTLMGDWVRHLGTTRRISAETEPGLGLARAIGGGCQICVAIDPVGALRSYAQWRVDLGDDPAASQALAATKDSVHEGWAALSVRARDDEAALGFGAQKKVAFEQPELWTAALLLAGAGPTDATQ